mmetsp:Transcript_22347/g.35721  ORF Transcript_22347/g.35721 Transcript_22347/m.35721 type:complete len:348 (-) Transcript_22347:2378-3421(-)
MILELGTDDDLDLSRIIERIGLSAVFNDHTHRFGQREIDIQRRNLGFDDVHRQAFEPGCVKSQTGTLPRNIVKCRPPAFAGQIIFLRTGFGAIFGQAHIISKLFASIRVSTIEQANSVVEALFIRAMHIPVSNVTRHFGLPQKAKGGIIGQIKGRVFVVKCIDHQDRSDVSRVFLLAKHRQAKHVDQRVAEFMVKDAKKVRLDKTIAFFVCPNRPRQNQKCQHVPHRASFGMVGGASHARKRRARVTLHPNLCQLGGHQSPVIQIKQHIRPVFPICALQGKRLPAFGRHQSQTDRTHTWRVRWRLVQHFGPRPNCVTRQARVRMRPPVQPHNHLRIGQPVERQGPRH